MAGASARRRRPNRCRYKRPEQPGWYQKRRFAFWRPVTAIRKAETDGNPDTSPDPDWLPLRPTPALPDYPSTHSLLGGAAAEILRRFTGQDHFRFCMTSTTSVAASSERCWNSLTDAELENAASRLLVGFHFRSACTTGVQVGRKVGRFAVRHSLRPLHNGHVRAAGRIAFISR